MPVEPYSILFIDLKDWSTELVLVEKNNWQKMFYYIKKKLFLTVSFKT